MDTKTSKKDHHIATLFPKKEDSTVLPRKETTKTPKIKKLACINMMSKVLAKLEKKFSIPMEKRKCAKFLRKHQASHPQGIHHRFPPLSSPWTWSDLSPRSLPYCRLVQPKDCPVYSASKDPDDYKMKSTSYSQDPQYSTFTSKNPFGALPGYRTTQGVVSAPSTSVQGYIYCPTARRWLLHASLNPVGRRPAGRGCPGTSRGERERGKKPHSLP